MSVLASGSRRTTRWIISVLVLGAVVGALFAGSAIAEGGANVAKNVLVDNLAEPLNGATSAKLDIDVGDGNLTVDRLTGGEPLLAGGTLEYPEKNGAPSRNLVSLGGQATYSLKAGKGGQSWFRLPWAACNGATAWQIHLNPVAVSEVSARTAGGNVKLDLADTAVASVSADTGGGNLEIVLPDGATSVSARSGAGNVTVSLPAGVAARIHAKTGVGKVIVDPRFSPVDKNTFESSDFASAADKVEITATSGAGNVIVEAR